MKKQLFKCSAYVNIEEKKNGYHYTLISYNTKICHVVISTDYEGWEDIQVALWRYPSTTSQMHIRKFSKWLKQNIKGSSAGRIVELLQDCCVEFKCNYGTYDGVFNTQNYNAQTLANLGFAYNKPY